MEGSNGKHVSKNASPEQATKPNEECITPTLNHPAIASSSRLDTKNYEALLSEVASKMVKISSTLYKVVSLVKIYWTQKKMIAPTKWALPLAFVVAINIGHSIEDLVYEFAPYCMPPFENLTHWEVITQMAQSPTFPAHFVAETLNDSSWTIADPIGYLGAGFCQHSGVYMLDWMDKDFPFKSSDFGGVKEDDLRMNLTMELILGEHNELKSSVEENSAKAWSTKRFA
ncbi:hypothetical protein TSUD_323540 [Trifolium subterraneum]|uniref:Uncharacterized protein n=1 Tax=Trifolium subterraneum TaxID=3900 RepID=A0A2Z6N6I3_TRISU|nr:hypothetical protein TSUD_323540 [Trifolium subterraneum]